MENFEIIVLLLTVVTVLAVVAKKVHFPFPILLVIIGLAVSLIPGLPVVQMNPDVVFIIFLPPILYEAAWNTSWHDFRANLRPITLAGVGLVFFTTAFVSIVAHSIIPGIGWPECFVLGAIVSPPDAVAATSITKGLGLHKRIITIIEGESLVNDASGLIAYRYGIAAVATGNFIFWKAGLEFLWVVSAGIAIGLLIGYAVYYLHKNIPHEPLTETTLTFLTPYISYLLAEHFHVSGVLAVVTTGLFVTYNQSEMFSHLTRMQAVATWQVVIFVLNGIVFILIGLQLRHVLEVIREHSLSELLIYGILVSLAVIFIRFVWVFPAAYIPRWLSPKIRKEYFSWKNVVIFSWSGMRGVVSMAAALALPLTLDTNPFPNRDLIIFLTFCVIISTLVIQGLTLPALIKALRIPKFSIVEEEFNIRYRMINNSVVYIEENLSFGEVSDEVLAQIKSKYEIKINKMTQTPLMGTTGTEINRAEQVFNQFNEVQAKLINVERNFLKQLKKDSKIDHEVLRKIEHELDLEEARLNSDKYEHT